MKLFFIVLIIIYLNRNVYICISKSVIIVRKIDFVYFFYFVSTVESNDLALNFLLLSYAWMPV